MWGSLYFPCLGDLLLLVLVTLCIFWNIWDSYKAFWLGRRGRVEQGLK